MLDWLLENPILFLILLSLLPGIFRAITQAFRAQGQATRGAPPSRAPRPAAPQSKPLQDLFPELFGTPEQPRRPAARPAPPPVATIDEIPEIEEDHGWQAAEREEWMEQEPTPPPFQKAGPAVATSGPSPEELASIIAEPLPVPRLTQLTRRSRRAARPGGGALFASLARRTGGGLRQAMLASFLLETPPGLRGPGEEPSDGGYGS